MGVFDKMAEHGHEQVVFCFDRQTGMRAIVAIHDTALGPARGGTRYKAYASEEDALEDVMRLSKGMTYKFAFTDMPRGGGKAVLLKQDGTADKRVLLRSFGRFVQLLAGRFGTGPDLGTSAQEMVDIARETDYVWAIDQRFGGTGDSTPLTARGVFVGIGRLRLECNSRKRLERGRSLVEDYAGAHVRHLGDSFESVKAAMKE